MSPRTVVVVEDSEEDFQTVLDAARRAGLTHPIVRASSGGDCLRLLRGTPRGRALLVLLEKRASRWAPVLALASTLALLGVAVQLLLQAHGGQVQAYLLSNWQAPWGIALALDRLTALMLLLTALVGLASLAAIEGAARNEAYAATKGAVVSMMKSIAVEHARYGIRANSILPGWIATDMTQGAQDNPAFAEKVIPRVPMRRWGEPKDFGGVAVYLTSDASSYHSGDSFVIDGAYSIF